VDQEVSGSNPDAGTIPLAASATADSIMPPPADTEDASPERLVVHRLEGGGAGDSFAQDVAAGLSAPRKFLLPKYFYDELGSHLFEAICLLPEYYVTRAESEILARAAGEIAAAVAGPLRLLELGSGSATKTRHLIEALLARQPSLHYLPIDIAEQALTESARALLEIYPRLSVTGYAGEFGRGLAAFGADGVPRDGARHTLALFLGSTIGNLEPAARVRLLGEVRAGLRPGDALLLGTDLRKSAAVLVPAYDDALGVTAAFNLNVLKRINQELGGTFDLRQFAHRAVYDEAEGRVEMHLVSRREQTVEIAGIGLFVHFSADETIHTESSYKFSRAELADLAERSGLALARTWLDAEERFSLNLMTVSPET
jgi:L-histidine Nalpha-methyltransferase